MLALVLDLLLLDETNPRSLAYQLASISQHLAGMPQSKQGASLTDERRLILSMLTSIRLADVEAFAKDCIARRSCRPPCATSSACCRSSPRPSSGTTSICSRSSRTASTRGSSPSHDLRCQPSHDLPLLDARGAEPAHRAHVAARGRAAARQGPHAAHRAGADDPDRARGLSTATAS